ncbi:hypothetical protein G647_00229 [Cladophialophora carrionii CBS 160.54]|uniref:Uncharacterized protein n=1 Tax=Cladophialophora carrionii CBS 160.54 TaxID=1279043 RepID=V9DLP8_9EURO|nr:uncharacterized protein G647_00229 [Cladophialophora carrionii CBS 160.54]ETI27780.1 hypothetical protein G647_00229 [Cladophialophora carrionii CBS 160.54]
MSTFTTSNEDLYAHGRRLHHILQSYRGDSPERQYAWDKWIEFNRKHPFVAKEVSSQSDIVSNDPLRPWNEADENRMYVDKTHWNSFLRGCAIGAGFRIEIETIVTFMRSQYVHMWRNKSQYGETYLVGWAIHHMPRPISEFLKWSISQEETEEQKCEWTINGFEQHLLTWAALFESNLAQKYYTQCRGHEDRRYYYDPRTDRIEQEFYISQPRTGGGPIAHFLYSRADHRRWAYQMFKTIWRCGFEDWAVRDGGVNVPLDSIMSG